MPSEHAKRPLNQKDAPDTARVYERAKPESESGMGRLDNNKAVPADHADHMPDAVSHKQPLRQINAEEEPKPRNGGGRS